MITKAIVEQVLDKYSIRVRIPTIDRTSQSSVHTKREDLNVALVCTLPGCDPNIQPGDIVYVALDDKNEDDAVILGYLYRSRMTGTRCDMILNDLSVTICASLPQETSIGNVTSQELSYLQGTTGNIQKQLDTIHSKLNRLLDNMSQSNDFDEEVTN